MGIVLPIHFCQHLLPQLSYSFEFKCRKSFNNFYISYRICHRHVQIILGKAADMTVKMYKMYIMHIFTSVISKFGMISDTFTNAINNENKIHAKIHLNTRDIIKL